MKALILNSGMGSRMGALTDEQPKCMTEISYSDTILSRQLKTLIKAGVDEIIITTGYYDRVLIAYCESLRLPADISFVMNPDYADTNYIYSIYCARKHLDDDLLLLLYGLEFLFQIVLQILRIQLFCMR